MKRSVLTLVVLCVIAVAQAEAQSGGPTFAVENPRIDIGEIKAGSDAVATFVFHNKGPTDVTIIKAKPS
jgi:hypothetical protein